MTTPQNYGEWCAALDQLVAATNEDGYEADLEKSAWTNISDYRTIQRARSNIMNAALTLRDALILSERMYDTINAKDRFEDELEVMANA